ncbi:hypothetical protein GPECTOR_7g1330 [Gonium pectorale]|uniref:Uncharacterized protein n=1 Tax=Gonium pectorale TaxID=33097 RepID=A0A150GUQ2_GONPE|nr:hypothetical protein GPECTOR_7g1330 [Gonium pectorale]|eukprot:KXZ53432.1 hypothetical protein GPECTOR_7g1330 [Gonium pectorale]
MEPLDKDKLPQNWRAPLIKVVSNHVWQVCDRVDLTDPGNHPNGDGSGKSPAYGAYAGPFAAWIGKTKVFNDLDLQWDFAISLPNQHLTRPVGPPTPPGGRPRFAHGRDGSSGSSNGFGAGASIGGAIPDTDGRGFEESRDEEDIPVEEQWSLVVWLKPGERGTTVDMARFVAVVDKMASPGYSKAASGSWDIFLSHYQGNAGNTVMSLKALLESASPGLRCWLDKDEDATETGMKRGGVLTRPFVQLEAREALALAKPVILVHETDQRFGAAPGFNDYVAEAPPDLKPMFSLANSIPWYREEEFRAVSIKKILQAAGRSPL